MINTASVGLISYIIGSIPTGFLFARWYGIRDIREHGSGGGGATNVSRMLGIHAFFTVFILDALKAYLCIFLLRYYQFSAGALSLSSVCLLLGNGYSYFLKGRAGKGVATSFGILAVLYPLLISIALPIWLFVLLSTKIVGLASVSVLIALPCIALYSVHDASLIVFMGVWGLFLHRENIREYIRKFKIS